MSSVHSHSKYRPGRIELVTAEAVEQVLDRQLEVHERQFRRRVYADQRPSGLGKSLQILEACFTDPASVFFRVAAGSVAAGYLISALIRQNYHVESRLEIAGSDVGICYRRVIKAELLENPARPAFIHRRCPALVKTEFCGRENLFANAGLRVEPAD